MAARGSDDKKMGLLPSAIAALALLKASRRIPPAGGTPPETPESLRLATAEAPDGGIKKLLWNADQFQRRHAVLGFPLAVLKKFGQDQGGYMAALVAYFGFFSIFPLMLAFTSTLGYVIPDPDDQQRFADAAADQIPVVGSTIRDTAGEITGSTLGIVVGIALALWSGLKIIDAMQNAMNNVWDVPPFERPNVLERRLRSFLMLLVVGGGLAGSIAVSSLATVVDVIPGIGRISIWGGSLVLSIVLYLISFQLLTDTRLTWRHLVPGAVLGGVAWWALQTFGTPLIARQQHAAGKAFGHYAAIIALLFFLFLAAQLSILAAEVGVVKARHLWPRSIYPNAFTEADLRVFEAQARASRLNDKYQVEVIPAHPHDPNP